MPESESRKHHREVEKILVRLATAVEEITREVGTTRQRAEEAESGYGHLREVMSGSGGGFPGNLDERLDLIVVENQRLRNTLMLARDKAERLRSRLAVVEDEV